MNLDGKVALITGYIGEYGREICTVLANAGVELWIHSFNKEDDPSEFCEELLSYGGRVFSYTGDITQPEEVEEMVNTIVKKSGKIDILINHAEIKCFKSMDEVSPEDWVRTFERNVDVPFLCCKEVLPHMVQQGEGYVVNLSSAAAITGEISPDYAASKSALNSMTKGLSREFKNHGIRVNGISPAVLYEENNKVEADRLKKAVANMVLVLTSPLGDYLNGETILMDEGESIG